MAEAPLTATSLRVGALRFDVVVVYATVVFPDNPTLGLRLYSGDTVLIYDGVGYVTYEAAELAAADAITARFAQINTRLAELERVRRKPGDMFITFDDVVAAGCVLLEGQTISGGAVTNPVIAARYPWMVVGSNLVLPDARGRFFRSWAHASVNDPDRTARTARVGGVAGDHPGTYQADDIRSSSQTFSLNIQHGDGEIVTGEALTSELTTGGRKRYWGATDPHGGAETRAMNIAYTVQMQLG
jgi:hypothetical protein